MKQLNRMAIYARKSKLTSKGDSIDNQIEMCKEYIQRNFSAEELEINVYEDEGISGKTLDRPAFKSIMKEEQNNPYDYRQYRIIIVVQLRSRIFRQVVHKFRRQADACQEIYVQDDGKSASKCAAKAAAANCAVLPILSSISWTESAGV